MMEGFGEAEDFAVVGFVVILLVGLVWILRDVPTVAREFWAHCSDWARVHEVVRAIDCTAWGLPKVFTIAQNLASTTPHDGTGTWALSDIASRRKWEFGHSVWNGAVALVRKFCEEQESLRFGPFMPRRTVIELGCGQALVSMVILELFPHVRRVVATDGSEEVLRAACANVDTNLADDLAHKLSVKLLRWDNDDDIEKARAMNYGKGYDVILGADVTYTDNHQLLLSAVQKLAHDKTELWIAHEPREHRPSGEVEVLLRENFSTVSGFNVELSADFNVASLGKALTIVGWRCTGRKTA